MLIFLVPVRRDGDERRADSSFAESEQESNGSEACEIPRRCQAHTNAAPYNADSTIRQRVGLRRQVLDLHCDSDQLCQAQSTHEVDEWILRDQLTWSVLA